MIIVPVQGVGYQTTEFMGFDDSDPEEAGNYDDIYIRFEGDNTLIFTNAWGIFSPGGWFTLYYGGFFDPPAHLEGPRSIWKARYACR